jgi:hypothetical protein
MERGADCFSTFDDLQGRRGSSSTAESNVVSSGKRREDMVLTKHTTTGFPYLISQVISPRQRARPATFPDRHEPAKNACQSALRKDQRPLASQTLERTGTHNTEKIRCLPKHDLHLLSIYTLYFELANVQCEDLYELISCLLPEVTASPAQHCTYSIFGTKRRGFDPYFLHFLLHFFSYCPEWEGRNEIETIFLLGLVGEILGSGLCFLLGAL